MNASRTTASTFSRVPSSTGWRPPSSSRASSTRPFARTGTKPKSARKSAGKIVRWTWKRSKLVSPFGIAVGERLERPGAPLARVADRGEEERLHHPRPRRIGEVGARDEDGVVARRAGGQLARAREEIRRPVLHRAEQPAVVVVVDRAPRAPLVLGVADPLALVGAAPVPRLPPDALVADGRRRLDRRARQPGDARASFGPHRVDDDLARPPARRRPCCARYSRTRSCTSLPDRRNRRAPLRDEVQLDPHGAVLARHAHRVPPRQRTVCEPSHSLHLPRRVRGVAGEDLGRDRRLTGHCGLG